MRTRLYNTETNEVFQIREGFYLVDGVRPDLPNNIIELNVQELPETIPTYNNKTEKLIIDESVDIENKLWILNYSVVQLTQQEIDNLKPKECTPRQLRLAMIRNNIDPDSIYDIINSITDANQKKEAYVEWEYAVTIDRNNPLIQYFSLALNKTEEDIDSIFELAITL